MPAPITGTTVWTFTNSNNASYISGAGGNARPVRRGCVDPSGTYYYYLDGDGTTLVRIDLTGGNAGKATKLYDSLGLGVTLYATSIDPSGTTLYLWQTNNGSGATRVLTLLADGSSVSPTEVMSMAGWGRTQRPYWDAVTGTWLVADGFSPILTFDPANWPTAGPGPILYYPADGPQLDTVTVHPGDPDKLVCGAVSDALGVMVVSRYQGRAWYVAGGSQSGAGGTGADPLAVATGRCLSPVYDPDGRIYYIDAANRVRRLDGSGVSDVASSGGTGNASLNYDAVNGCLYVNSGSGTLVKLT